jgi:hypothetical protein
MNPVVHIEIPVLELDRAMWFYNHVFGVRFGEVVTIGEDRFAFFPFAKGKEGASLALACGEVYEPTLKGPIIYLAVEDIDTTVERACTCGSQLLFAKTIVGPDCVIAEICDSEGNRVGLQEVSA